MLFPSILLLDFQSTASIGCKFYFHWAWPSKPEKNMHRNDNVLLCKSKLDWCSTQGYSIYELNAFHYLLPFKQNITPPQNWRKLWTSGRRTMEIFFEPEMGFLKQFDKRKVCHATPGYQQDFWSRRWIWTLFSKLWVQHFNEASRFIA